MKYEFRKNYSAYVLAEDILKDCLKRGAGGMKVAALVRESKRATDVAAALGIIAADRRYNAETRAYARAALDTLICG